MFLIKNKNIKLKNFFLFLLLSSSVFFISSSQSYEIFNKNEEIYCIDKEKMLLINEGDIILRRGYGLVSNLIVEVLNEPIKISHCGIITKIKNKYYVIHCVSRAASNFDGMQINTLEDFIKESKKNSVMIIRFKNTKNNLLARRAEYYLNKKVPFDHSFDITENTSFFCTELIWRVIKDVYEIDIFEDDDKKSLRFESLYKSNFFEIVLNDT